MGLESKLFRYEGAPQDVVSLENTYIRSPRKPRFIPGLSLGMKGT
jgi:hypothetical protein